MRYLAIVLGLAVFVRCGEDVVVTSLGAIQGTVYDDSRGFTGIPYAETTAGANRWAAPVAKRAWAPGMLVANVSGVGCPQICVLPPHNCPTTVSEDCLQLNVWTPRVDNGTLLPVMVFLPGGRFEQGFSSSVLYEGRNFANATRVILVTVNYRLGVLGFLVTGPSIRGNFGFLDQQLALQWVQDNIRAFGGDPAQVTLFGQSAGASSTACHLVAKTTKATFQRAIMESVPLTLAMKPTADAASGLGALFVKTLGCGAANNLTCLRNKSIPEILAAQATSENHIFLKHPLDVFLPWTPCVDGETIPAQPVDLLRRGVIPAGVTSVAAGTVHDEAVMFIAEGFGKPISPSEYLVIITAIFGPVKALKVGERYPCTKGDCRTVMMQMTTPFIFVCPTRWAMRGIAPKINQSTYMYRFSHIMSFSKQAWGPNYTFCDDVVCHGSELPFVFNSAQYAGLTFTPEEEDLARLMRAFWGNFGTTGSPNRGASSPALTWSPAGNGATEPYLEFATPSSTGTNLAQGECDFWDTIGYDY